MADQDWTTALEVAEASHEAMVDDWFSCDDRPAPPQWFVDMHIAGECPICGDDERCSCCGRQPLLSASLCSPCKFAVCEVCG